MHIMILYMFTFKAYLTDLYGGFYCYFQNSSFSFDLAYFFPVGYLRCFFQVVVSSHQKEVLFYDRHVVERSLLITSKNKHVPLYFLWNTSWILLHYFWTLEKRKIFAWGIHSPWLNNLEVLSVWKLFKYSNQNTQCCWIWIK